MHEGPGIAPAEGLPQDTDETHDLQQRLAAVEKERDKAKQQLNRYSPGHILLGTDLPSEQQYLHQQFHQTVQCIVIFPAVSTCGAWC